MLQKLSGENKYCKSCLWFYFLARKQTILAHYLMDKSSLEGKEHSIFPIINFMLNLYNLENFVSVKYANISSHLIENYFKFYYNYS